MSKLECTNRDELYIKLSNLIIMNLDSYAFQFVGKNGTGKEYVLNKLENTLKNKCEIYRIISDTLIKKKSNISTYKVNVVFSLSNFIGMSLSLKKNDSSKINYIISNLKTFTFKKLILISAIGYDTLPSESRQFIDIILCNKKFIEEKIKKKLTIIITSNEDYFNGKYNVENVIFKDYEQADVYNYLIDTCGYNAQQITNKQLNQIYKLCGTNLDLVNNYAKLILNNTYLNTNFESIVDTKLNYYIQSGNKYSLSKEDLKYILLTSAMSLNILTTDMISSISSINEKNVQKGFDCAINEKFIQKEFNSEIQIPIQFSFISKEEKNYLYHLAQKSNIQKTVDYYIYLSKVAEDEYFERAQYLFYNYGIINKYVFALLILAVSKSFLLNDNIQITKIKDFFYSNNNNAYYKQLFEDICSAYTCYYCENYKKTIYLLEKIDYSEINIVLAAELRRLEFKSGYMGKLLTQEEINVIVGELQAYLEKKIFLNHKFPFNSQEEKILSLRIIYELAPYMLDTQNDKESFLKLYDHSLLLVNYINNHFIKKSFAEYVINVFNRKAFLFAVPSQAVVYYEQAVNYFKDNKIWSEYVIALASKAGNEIAIHKYEKAIKSCKIAIKTMNDFQLKISQKEKIYNNLYLAEYLDLESKNNIKFSKVKNAAIRTSEKLKSLLTDIPCGTNHVILTNIAALYLYAGEESKYYKAKEQLEDSLGCKDVSALNDVSINDFYRYHFAWYEFYIQLNHHNWEKCSQIVNQLDLFYPSIFHNILKMNLRVEAARSLVNKKCVPDIQKYGLNMLQYAPSNTKLYSSRGLPVSDLQFTSWE